MNNMQIENQPNVGEEGFKSYAALSSATGAEPDRGSTGEREMHSPASLLRKPYDLCQGEHLEKDPSWKIFLAKQIQSGEDGPSNALVHVGPQRSKPAR